VQVVIANCDLALGRGDVDAAVAILSQVSQGSNYYVPAKVALADIYMKHQHDKARFSKCYLDIVQLFPNSKTYLMLGEAFMRIDESEQAMKAYVAASKESPQDASVASQVGHALVATHNYGKAMEHYESALPIVEDGLAKLDLCYDVAGLHCYSPKCKTYSESRALPHRLHPGHQTLHPNTCIITGYIQSPPFATFVHVLMKILDLCCKCYMLYYEMVIAGDVKCKRSSQQLSTRAPWASFRCNPGSEACCC
jgi:tetratricopeptide (TPR) repeat protein